MTEYKSPVEYAEALVPLFERRQDNTQIRAAIIKKVFGLLGEVDDNKELIKKLGAYERQHGKNDILDSLKGNIKSELQRRREMKRVITIDTISKPIIEMFAQSSDIPIIGILEICRNWCKIQEQSVENIDPETFWQIVSETITETILKELVEKLFTVLKTEGSIDPTPLTEKSPEDYAQELLLRIQITNELRIVLAKKILTRLHTPE